jgi:hypothetical protein
MSRFKRLTDAEARSLTRAELLDRVEAEQAYWFRKRHMSADDRDAEREFSRIMHAYLSPAAAIQDVTDYIEGRGPGNYWQARADMEVTAALPMDDNQRAGLAYARMLLDAERAAGTRAESEPEPEIGP